MDALSVASHAHVMSLSSDFHDAKTTSELSQAIHGGKSVLSLVELVCFEVLPMFIDLSLAFLLFWSLYGPYMGLLVTTVSAMYMYTTSKMIAMRSELRRQYIIHFRKEWSAAQSSIDGWVTASVSAIYSARFPCANNP